MVLDSENKTLYFNDDPYLELEEDCKVITVSYKGASVEIMKIYYEGFTASWNSATIYDLISEEKRKGYASKVIDHVCKIADVYNIELSLFVRPAEDFDNYPPDFLTHEQLVNFYKRKGFVFDSESSYGIQKYVRMAIKRTDFYSDTLNIESFLMNQSDHDY